VRLLLDEMWPPAIAMELRRRGHDVEAVAERLDLRGMPDEVIFSVAQREGRAIVTEDVADYRPFALQAVRDGNSHAGVVFTLNRTFPRSDRRTAGRLVAALDRLLADSREAEGFEHWLT